MNQRREFLYDSLHIFVLSNFAVAQPLFDLLSKHPTFFVARRSEPGDILALTVLLAVVLPAALIAVELGATLLGISMRRALHYVFIFALATLTSLPVSKRLGNLPGTVLLLGSAALGALATLAYARLELARTFVTVLSPAPLVFAALFLLYSPVATLLHPAAIASPSVRAQAGPPVIMVIFDELPLTSLMNEQREIDSTSYPNFAAFARDAFWFRNATAVSDHTHIAVPAILTGRFPTGPLLPNSSGYPNNLFTLLGGSYALEVTESLTQLCPRTLCESQPASKPFSRRMEALLSDVTVVYLHALLPPEFARRLPPIGHTWGGFTPGSGGPAVQGLLSDDAIKELVVTAMERMRDDRGAAFRHFIDSIRQRDQPVLYFLHILLPHVPWTYLPSGKVYEVGFAEIPDLKNELWGSDELSVFQGFQRHLLQLRFVDVLVGELVAHLKRVGLYDPSLIILTADHGVSFRPGDSRRYVTKTNAPDILSVPLFIKRPNEKHGEVSDRNVMSIDILPTIAGELGMELPWPVDGLSVFDTSTPEPPAKTFFAKQTAKDRLTFGPHEIDTYETLQRKFSLFGPVGDGEQLAAIGPHRELMGKRISELEVTTGNQLEIELAQPDLLTSVDPDAGFVPAQIAGRIRTSDRATAGLDLAISVNETIQATTRTHQGERGEFVFSAIVPEGSLQRGNNTVEVFAVSIDEGRVRLTSTNPVASAWSPSRPLSVQRKGEGEVIESSSGTEVAILPTLGGWLDSAEIGTDDVELVGWAADIESGEPAESVGVFVNGRLAYAGPTTQHRLQVATAYRAPGLKRSGFTFRMPLSLFGEAQQSEVRLFALSRKRVAFELGYPDSYPFRKPMVLPPRIVPPSYDDEGYFDAADCHSIRGWVWDARQPNGAIDVDVYDGDVLLASVPADQYRKHLADAGKGDGRHAFAYTVPTSLKDGRPHAIRVMISGTQIGVSDTPKSITCLDYEGFHASADCNAIAGWVWREGQPNAPIDVDIFDGDSLLVRVAADQFRQHLADAGKGDGHHAFLYRVPAALKDGRPHAIRVMVSDTQVELLHTPKTITCLDYEGFHASADCNAIAGWAWREGQPNTPIDVDIFDGDTLLARVPADQFRQDLADAGKGDGRHAFLYPAPAALNDGRTHAIRVMVSGTQVELLHTPKSITCLDHEGFHDTADCSKIAGWAWRRSQPNTPIDVDIYDGDTLLARLPADRFRQDLADAGKGNGAHGFVYTPLSRLGDGQPHSISVKISDTDIQLTNTPKLAQCQE